MAGGCADGVYSVGHCTNDLTSKRPKIMPEDGSLQIALGRLLPELRERFHHPYSPISSHRDDLGYAHLPDLKIFCGETKFMLAHRAIVFPQSLTFTALMKSSGVSDMILLNHNLDMPWMLSPMVAVLYRGTYQGLLRHIFDGQPTPRYEVIFTTLTQHIETRIDHALWKTAAKNVNDLEETLKVKTELWFHLQMNLLGHRYQIASLCQYTQSAFFELAAQPECEKMYFGAMVEFFYRNLPVTSTDWREEGGKMRKTLCHFMTPRAVLGETHTHKLVSMYPMFGRDLLEHQAMIILGATRRK